MTTTNEMIACFGLTPDKGALPTIREMLQAEAEKQRQYAGDVELLRLMCVQLFAAGQPQDALLIWYAKGVNFDTGCGIDVQLLCGAGLEQTRDWMEKESSPEAKEALDYLIQCEKAGDFDMFSPQKHLEFYLRYFTDDEQVA